MHQVELLLSRFDALVSVLSEADFEAFYTFHEHIIKKADEPSLTILWEKLEKIKKYAQNALVNLEAMNLEDEKKSIRLSLAQNLLHFSNNLNLISESELPQKIPTSFIDLDASVSLLAFRFSSLVPLLPKTFGKIIYVMQLIIYLFMF